MWHHCLPTYDNRNSPEEFWPVADWTVPGVGEVGFNGPLQSIAVRGTSLGFRFMRTSEEREGHAGIYLPRARFVVTGSSIDMSTPSRPPRWLLRPPLGLGYELPSVEWRESTDELRIAAAGMETRCHGGLWHWDIEGRGFEGEDLDRLKSPPLT